MVAKDWLYLLQLEEWLQTCFIRVISQSRLVNIEHMDMYTCLELTMTFRLAPAQTVQYSLTDKLKEPLILHNIPVLTPWITLAIDILEFKGQSYLVVVDCMSHFSSLCRWDIIMALKFVYSVHGKPMSIIAVMLCKNLPSPGGFT